MELLETETAPSQQTPRTQLTVRMQHALFFSYYTPFYKNNKSSSKLIRKQRVNYKLIDEFIAFYTKKVKYYEACFLVKARAQSVLRKCQSTM
ncbi:hypothetical protein FACS1894122_09900 [Alphaproteobacteria bacterium]|nr:hypothetical protein FACS1894122_09900 [Alphaproteobacteria bacterium]